MAKRNYGRMTADGGLCLFRPMQLNLTMPPKTLDPRVPRRTSRSLGCFPLAAACLKVKNLTKLAQFRPA